MTTPPDKVFPGFLTFIHRDSDKLYIRVFTAQFIEIGHFSHTRATPGRPKIDIHRFTFIITQFSFLTLGSHKIEIDSRTSFHQLRPALQTPQISFAEIFIFQFTGKIFQFPVFFRRQFPFQFFSFFQYFDQFCQAGGLRIIENFQVIATDQDISHNGHIQIIVRTGNFLQNRVHIPLYRSVKFPKYLFEFFLRLTIAQHRVRITGKRHIAIRHISFNPFFFEQPKFFTDIFQLLQLFHTQGS